MRGATCQLLRRSTGLWRGAATPAICMTHHENNDPGGRDSGPDSRLRAVIAAGYGLVRRWSRGRRDTPRGLCSRPSAGAAGGQHGAQPSPHSSRQGAKMLRLYLRLVADQLWNRRTKFAIPTNTHIRPPGHTRPPVQGRLIWDSAKPVRRLRRSPSVRLRRSPSVRLRRTPSTPSHSVTLRQLRRSVPSLRPVCQSCGA